MTEIRWVGHAGFLQVLGESVLLTDPWLADPAFNQGWDLLVPSVLGDTDVELVTHVWISHEHPDHFSPASLRSIKERSRHPPTVIFQRTRDRRVLAWCERNGFPTRELDANRWVDLGEGVDVLLGQIGLYDSWLATRWAGTTVLNLNDCPVVSAVDLRRVKDLVGSVDCLVTQFSYANWMGNPEDREFRAHEARRRVERLEPQIKHLQPTTVIPAASFVWFSHEENAYLNDHRVPVREACRLIARYGSSPRVLAPGSSWTVGEAWDSEPDLKEYEDAWDIGGRPLHSSEPVPLADLETQAQSSAQRLLGENNRALVWLAGRLRRLPTLRVHLWDHDVTAEVGATVGLTILGGGNQDAEISMGSDSLAFIYKFDFGLDTLLVNGRFRSKTTSDRALHQAFWLATFHNAGRSLRFRELLEPGLYRIALRKIRRRLPTGRRLE